MLQLATCTRLVTARLPCLHAISADAACRLARQLQQHAPQPASSARQQTAVLHAKHAMVSQSAMGGVLQQAEAAQAQANAEEGVQEVATVDQWIVDFAGLFREQLGIEPDRHLDLTTQVPAFLPICFPWKNI